MKSLAIVALALFGTVPIWADPEPKHDESMVVEVLGKYQDALRRQQDSLKNVAMDVTMEAWIPKLKKQGRLSALRRISALGRIMYKPVNFVGDELVKKEIIARFMTLDVEAATSRRDDIGINEQNYNFKYKGLENRGERRVHLFELKPKEKRLGLFKGELWLDPETFLPVREQGRLVKNPSMFIKRMEFIRDYEIRDGVAYLVHMESDTDTRLVGHAKLAIDYANFQRQETSAEEPVEEAKNR